jgi:hypothetical protein
MELISLFLSVLKNTQLGVVSSILTMPILFWLVKEFQKHIKEDKAVYCKLNGAVVCLLRKELIELHSKAIAKRAKSELIGDYELQQFYDCLESYKECGGNSFVDRLVMDMDKIRDAKLIGGGNV